MKVYLKVKEFDEIRLRKGKSRRGLARETGINYRAIAPWVIGGAVSPKSTEIMLRFFGVEFVAIFEIREKDEAPCQHQ